MYICIGTHVPWCMDGCQRMTFRSQFSYSSMCVWEIEVKSSGLLASVSTCWLILPVLFLCAEPNCLYCFFHLCERGGLLWKEFPSLRLTASLLFFFFFPTLPVSSYSLLIYMYYHTSYNTHHSINTSSYHCNTGGGALDLAWDLKLKYQLRGH